MRRLSIGVRLTLWYLAFFALAQFVFGIGMWLILRDNIYDLVDDGLEQQIVGLENFLQSEPPGLSIADLRKQVTDVYAIEHSGIYLQLYEDGELIYRSSSLSARPISAMPPSSTSPPILESREVEGKPFRFIEQQLSVHNRVFGVEMGATAEDAVATLHQFESYLLMFAPLLLLAAAGGGYWLSRRALSPVDAMVRTAREITGTKLNSRLQKLETGDEFERLSDTLNEMLDRIESAFLRITEFTADASHELRTPVSLIRTEAELALRRSRSEAEYKESLRQILGEAERTTVLIEQLLSLARADAKNEPVNLQPVDLQQTLRSVVDGWQHVATIRNLKFSVTLNLPDAFVLGDEMLLRRLADILLDNAFKYTTPPGTVCLSLESKGENVVIMVKDSGTGIAQEDQGKIFERFYRVDKARSRAQGGAGLGLAIARWIVNEHHGSISVESRSGEGATFLVELPMTPMPVRTPLPA